MALNIYTLIKMVLVWIMAPKLNQCCKNTAHALLYRWIFSSLFSYVSVYLSCLSVSVIMSVSLSLALSHGNMWIQKCFIKVSELFNRNARKFTPVWNRHLSIYPKHNLCLSLNNAFLIQQNKCYPYIERRHFVNSETFILLHSHHWECYNHTKVGSNMSIA